MPIQKQFIFRVHSRDGTFLHSTEKWDFEEIIREVNGSMYMKLQTDILTKDIGNAITALMNQVTLTIASAHTGSEGLDYFSGYIPKRILNMKPNDERVIVDVFGHASRLWEMLYRNGTTIVMDFTGASTAKASEIASDILDKVQALDSNWPVDEATGTVEDSTTDIQDKFKSSLAGDAMSRCVFLAFDTNRIWHWLVKGDNVFHFKKANTTADHKFTFGYDVTDFPELSEDLMQSKNEIFVQYNNGANVRRRADAASITAYGNRSLVVTENNAATEATADEIGDAYLATYLPPLRTVKVTINDTYVGGIENINPGDTCKIMNLPIEISDLLTENMFIVRTTYRKDHVILELSLQHPQVGSQIEHIRRRLQQVETEDQSATTYA